MVKKIKSTSRKEDSEKNKQKDNDENSIQYEKNKDILSFLRNTWKFLWYDDSVLSWLANIVVAYLFIVFIFYPGMGLVLNTSYPLVAVVSGSMEHMKINHNDAATPNLCGNVYKNTDYFVNFNEFWQECGSWYEKQNITKSDFGSYTFKNGFNKGDIIFIYGTEPKNLKIGDVIVFKSSVRAEPIIHRIVNIHNVKGELVFTTKGDHNGSYGKVDVNITEDEILGRGIFRVPYLGWFKIWITTIVNGKSLQ